MLFLKGCVFNENPVLCVSYTPFFNENHKKNSLIIFRPPGRGGKFDQIWQKEWSAQFCTVLQWKMVIWFIALRCKNPCFQLHNYLHCKNKLLYFKRLGRIFWKLITTSRRILCFLVWSSNEPWINLLIVESVLEFTTDPDSSASIAQQTLARDQTRIENLFSKCCLFEMCLTSRFFGEEMMEI